MELAGVKEQLAFYEVVGDQVVRDPEFQGADGHPNLSACLLSVDEPEKSARSVTRASPVLRGEECACEASSVVAPGLSVDSEHGWLPF